MPCAPEFSYLESASTDRVHPQTWRPQRRAPLACLTARGVFCCTSAGAQAPHTASTAQNERQPSLSEKRSAMTEQATGAPKPQPRARTVGHQQAAPVEMTGAQSLIRSLEEAGADTVFGIPGGAILPAYDPMMDSARVRHVLVRHEQGAGHAATGYAQATGKVGVCMATSGPGATNLVTPLADAHMDSVPMVAITGQVASGSIGTDAFQEADICGISMPVTKHNFLVTDPDDIPRTIAEAFHIASTGRPGPVAGGHRQGRAPGPYDLLLAARPGPARLPPGDQAARQADPRSRQAARRGPPPGALRRRRRPEGAGHRGAEGARRADEGAGDHHPDGPRGLPRQPSAAPGHARHARHRGGRHLAPEGRPDRRPRCPLRRPGDGQARLVRAAWRRSSTRTSTPPRSARTASRTSRSSATPARSSPISSWPCRPSWARRRQPTSTASAHRGRTRRIPGLVAAAEPLAGDVSARLRPARGRLASPRSRSSSASASWPRRTPSTRRAWASTRCGPRTSSATNAPRPGSTPAAWARWATPSPRRWAPRSAGRRARSGPSTVTAASR